MLFNGSELRDEVNALIESSSEEILIISAFVKTSIIDDVMKLAGGRKVVVYVRWQLLDILRKVSDFETLFEICQRLGLELYYNQRLHAKVIIADQKKAIVGSSNYTQSGLGSGNNNIEWNASIHDLSILDFKRILDSLEDSFLVDENVMKNFRKALSKYEKNIDFEEIEGSHAGCLEGPLVYYSEFQKKLPPFEPSKIDLSLVEHKIYLQSLGFLSKPPNSILVTAIKDSFFGQAILEKLNEQPVGRKGLKILRWGDVGYSNYDFYCANDGLHNLFLWLSMISEEYSFYIKRDYPKGTCSLNYTLK